MSKLKIMIVDDSPIVLELLETHFNDEGFDVVTRNSPMGCGAAVIREKPDMLLIDVQMPLLNGDEVVKNIRKSAIDKLPIEMRKTLVMLFSGLPEEQLQAMVARSGADGYVRKTDKAEDIVRAVKDLLKSRMELAHDDVAAADATCIFVDDDEYTLRSLKRALSGKVNALYANSAQEALNMIEHAPNIKLIVTDIMMAGMTGADLYWRLTAKSSDWQNRFVFLTGAIFDSFVASFIDKIKAPVVHKPYTNTEIETCLSTKMQDLGITGWNTSTNARA